MQLNVIVGCLLVLLSLHKALEAKRISSSSQQHHSRRKTIGSYRRFGIWTAGFAGLTGLAGYSIWSREQLDSRRLGFTRRIVYGDRGGLVDVPESIRISTSFSKNSNYVPYLKTFYYKMDFNCESVKETNEDDDRYVCVNEEVESTNGSVVVLCAEPEWPSTSERSDDDQQVWHGVCCEDAANRDVSVCCFVNFLNAQPASVISNLSLIVALTVSVSCFNRFV